MGLLTDKVGLVFGVANRRSIAWAIAQAWHQEGARLAFTYQGERVKEYVEELVSSFGPETLLLPCDVTKDEEINHVFSELQRHFGRLHLLLHSVAFAPKEALEGEFLQTRRDAFRLTLDISAYSLVALSRAAAPLMSEGGSILAMSYYGAEKVVPHYNVMGVAKAALECTCRYLAAELGRTGKGIRINTISGGPLRTLSAMGVGGLSLMLDQVAAKAPLGRNIEGGEVGDTAVWLLSNLSTGVTGQTIHVDSGYCVMGM